MLADIFYAMGSSHHVCQDFAVANGDFVILSDGCSSAKDSDWGARILVKACQNVIKQRNAAMDFVVLSRGVLNLADSYVKMLNLEPECLAATLLCAYKTEKSINAFVTGDGYVIAHNKKNDNLLVFGHVFESGAPYYLYYSLNDGLRKSYYDTFGLNNYNVEKVIISKEVTTFSTRMMLEESKFVNYLFPTDEYDMVAVMSDGLKTFVEQVKSNTSIQNKNVDYLRVLKDLVDFKSTTGQFVHRRCQRVLRDYLASGIKHTDDFSMGVVYA